MNVVEIKIENHSVKDSGMRPAFESLLVDLRSGKFNGIIAWNPPQE